MLREPRPIQYHPPQLIFGHPAGCTKSSNSSDLGDHKTCNRLGVWRRSRKRTSARNTSPADKCTVALQDPAVLATSNAHNSRPVHFASRQDECFGASLHFPPLLAIAHEPP